MTEHPIPTKPWLLWRGSAPDNLSAEQLVDELQSRLRRINLAAVGPVVVWAEESQLRFADVLLLLALESKEGATTGGELSKLSGFPLAAVHPALHRLRERGYVHEEEGRQSLAESGRELVTEMNEVHRAGIRAFLSELGPDEQMQLEVATAEDLERI